MPERFAGMATRQVKGDGQALRRLAHPAADLDETEAQGVQLEAGDAGLHEVAAQRVEQPVGGGMQQEAELIGPEAVAAEAIGEAGVLEVFDPQLRFAPTHVPVVEGERREIGPAGHHKAQIAPFGQFLGFVDHAPLVGPRVGGIAPLAGQAHFLARLLVLLRRLRHKGSGERAQPGVRRQAQGVGDVLTLTVGIQSGEGEAAVGAQCDRDVGPTRTQGGNEASEDADHPATGVRGSWAQDRGDELVGLAVIDEQRMR
jgi:hypothetical protein